MKDLQQVQSFQTLILMFQEKSGLFVQNFSAMRRFADLDRRSTIPRGGAYGQFNKSYASEYRDLAQTNLEHLCHVVNVLVAWKGWTRHSEEFKPVAEFVSRLYTPSLRSFLLGAVPAESLVEKVEESWISAQAALMVVYHKIGHSEKAKARDASTGKRGRKPKYDPRTDKRLVDAWKASAETADAFALKHSTDDKPLTGNDVRKAKNRVRGREARKD